MTTKKSRPAALIGPRFFVNNGRPNGVVPTAP